MYTKIELSYQDVPQLSSRDKAYQRSDKRLKPFYKYEVELSSFAEIAEHRRSAHIDRQLLVDQLILQYQSIDTSQLTLDNILSLKSEDTFTIITAHQPSLLTGPLYFIYKICSVLSLVKKLNSTQHFKTVPVLILGGEDHDFEEIATAHIFGQDFTWETDQVGPTGRMSLDGLDAVIGALYERLGSSPHAAELHDIIESALKKAKSYGDFMIRFVNRLFKDHGLIIVNMDNPSFKEKLLPYVIRDIKKKDSVRCVEQDQGKLIQAGFKGRAHARTVNIFWIDGDRYRVIDNEDGTYNINDQVYNQEQLFDLLHSNPSSVSPNVILRPIYQELIFPNLAYVGGGGELAYWLERKSLFETWDISYPMLIRRDSLKVIDKRSHKWLTSCGLTIADLFEREEKVIGKYTHLQSSIDIDLSNQKRIIEDVFTQISTLASKIDPTLSKTVASESSKAFKSLQYIESKLLKAEKQKNEIGINKLSKLKNKFFPGNDGLQERYDNFIPFYLRYGKSWVEEIINQADPLNKNFKILVEEG